ncbi:gamma-glutamyl-gamma-aminobutyrate hydrolase family protein, partial [Arthrospira platensis SPKY1]|nr:gamma-glutamyl-gamma-aminobutyrate hydrolase family protein [Arthrospira platensis SPKY1]
MAYHHAHPEWVLILDFGSQYTQLIARRLREIQVYCEIHPFNADLQAFNSHPPKGVILSGGPKSVNDPDAPALNEQVFDWSVPVLGVCYGLQSLANRAIPGSVDNSDRREFGRAHLQLLEAENELFQGIPNNSQVWMSHGDHVHRLAEEYRIIACTKTV